MSWLISVIKKFIDEKKYGKIEINFQAGGISNVVVSESFKEIK